MNGTPDNRYPMNNTNGLSSLLVTIAINQNTARVRIAVIVASVLSVYVRSAFHKYKFYFIILSTPLVKEDKC